MKKKINLETVCLDQVFVVDGKRYRGLRSDEIIQDGDFYADSSSTAQDGAPSSVFIMTGWAERPVADLEARGPYHAYRLL